MTPELKKYLESLGYEIIDAPNDDKIYGRTLAYAVIDDALDCKRIPGMKWKPVKDVATS